MPLVYEYDGTLDGFFSCVFQSYRRKEIPDAVYSHEGIQFGFEQELFRVETNREQAARVVRGLSGICGQPIYEKVHTCFLSHEYDRATKLLRYVHLAFARGRAVEGMLTHPDVLPVDAMYRQISKEQYRFHEFIRFSKLENGVYYARIQPHNYVMPLIMPFFADRYNDQPFLIFDPVHSVAGVYDLQDWFLVETEEINLPDYDEEEGEWRRLWKEFYQSVAIRERRNEKLRRQLCPKRYWADMLEMPVVIRP